MRFIFDQDEALTSANRSHLVKLLPFLFQASLCIIVHLLMYLLIDTKMPIQVKFQLRLL